MGAGYADAAFGVKLSMASSGPSIGTSPALQAPVARRSRPVAQWAARFPIGPVLATLVIGELLTLVLVFAARGDDAPRGIVGAGLLVIDAVFLAMIVIAARRGTGAARRRQTAAGRRLRTAR